MYNQLNIKRRWKNYLIPKRLWTFSAAWGQSKFTRVFSQDLSNLGRAQVWTKAEWERQSGLCLLWLVCGCPSNGSLGLKTVVLSQQEDLWDWNKPSEQLRIILLISRPEQSRGDPTFPSSSILSGCCIRQLFPINKQIGYQCIWVVLSQGKKERRRRSDLCLYVGQSNPLFPGVQQMPELTSLVEPW